MSTSVDPLDVDQFDLITVNDALRMGLIYLKSDLPRTDGRLSRMVEDLVKNTTLSYTDIVAKVKTEFPQANTSTKSVASVACVMRKKGVRVPLRLKLNIVD
jgi:hypothetical protein